MQRNLISEFKTICEAFRDNTLFDRVEITPMTASAWFKELPIQLIVCLETREYLWCTCALKAKHLDRNFTLTPEELFELLPDELNNRAIFHLNIFQKIQK